MYSKDYPRLTRKQFEFIAFLVGTFVPIRYWKDVARELRATNRMFDEQKFLAAVEKYHRQYKK